MCNRMYMIFVHSCFWMNPRMNESTHWMNPRKSMNVQISYTFKHTHKAYICRSNNQYTVFLVFSFPVFTTLAIPCVVLRWTIIFSFLSTQKWIPSILPPLAFSCCSAVLDFSFSSNRFFNILQWLHFSLLINTCITM